MKQINFTDNPSLPLGSQIKIALVNILDTGAKMVSGAISYALKNPYDIIISIIYMIIGFKANESLDNIEEAQELSTWTDLQEYKAGHKG